MDKKSLKKIMEQTINPRELALKKYSAYKLYICDLLRDIARQIEDGDFETVIKNNSFLSHAGDGWGNTNTCINFSYDETQKDIEQALNYLEFLRKYAYEELDLDAEFDEYKDYLPYVN